MPRAFLPPPQPASVVFEDQPLDYLLVFRPRRSIGFAVRPDGSVLVTAPAGVPATWVARQVLKKAAWIRKHQAAFRRRPAPPTADSRYAAGSTHFFRGQPHTLHLAEAARPSVLAEAGELRVVYPAPHTPTRTEAVLRAWHGQQLRAALPAALARVWPRFAEFNLPAPALLVRAMRTRWGSCTPGTGRIRLSPDLARATPDCLDYVLLHECCHLLVPDHSAAFYALQTRLLPDWPSRKAALNALPK